MSSPTCCRCPMEWWRCCTGVGRELITRGERAAGAWVGGADKAARRDLYGIRRCARRTLSHFVAALFQRTDGVGRQSSLDRDLVRRPLIVDARRRYGVGDWYLQGDPVDHDLQQ